MQRRLPLVVLAMIVASMACNLPQGVVTRSTVFPPTAVLTSPPDPSLTPLPSTETFTPTGESAPSPTTQASIEEETCSSESPAVTLLVDSFLVDSIRARLTQFENDLCQAGYEAIEIVTDLATPPEVRAYLADLYNQTEERLVGAYLIGDIPHAYQLYTVTYTNPDIPTESREVISYQYYADLDGVFEASADFTSPGGHLFSYDIHKGSIFWEIWIGVLPLYKGDHQLTVEALNHYFEKNHAYRIGEYDIPHAYLEIDEFFTATTEAEYKQYMERKRSGDYAWTPFSDSPEAHIFFDSLSTGLSVTQGYEALSEGVADFTSVGAHGTWQASGSINIDWLESNPVRTVFYYTSGCASGNLDHADNFLTSILYSPTSMVLVAWGTTDVSGGMGTNEDGFFGHNVASDLSQGKSFGEAILEHVNTHLIYPWSENREAHFALQLFLGDPTLSLHP